MFNSHECVLKRRIRRGSGEGAEGRQDMSVRDVKTLFVSCLWERRDVLEGLEGRGGEGRRVRLLFCL